MCQHHVYTVRNEFFDFVAKVLSKKGSDNSKFFVRGENNSMSKNRQLVCLSGKSAKGGSGPGELRKVYGLTDELWNSICQPERLRTDDASTVITVGFMGVC